MKRRALIVGALVLAAVALASWWYVAADFPSKQRRFDRYYVIVGEAPWCAVPRVVDPPISYTVRCHWLSEVHCQLNILGSSDLCVQNPDRR